MKNLLHKIGVGMAAAIITGALAAATYEQFSPGGALSGTWNSQSVNVGSGAFITGRLPYANLAQGSGNSVLGVGGASTADNASIVAGSDGQVLRRAAGAVGFGQVDLTSANAVTGALGVANGGTGLATLAQGSILYGNGSSPLSVLSKNVTATRYLSNTGTNNDPAWAQVNLSNGVTGNLSVNNLNSGSGASGSTYWRGDGVWSSIPGGAVGANPTGTIGLTAVNGSSVDFMRSDGAPALSQAIAPTWTGLHTYARTAADEQVRLARDNAFLSWYNAANTTRTGYIQGNAGAGITFSSEVGTLTLAASNNVVALPTSSTVGGSAICRASGTGCPSSGGVTSISAGTGISLSPSPITTTGTVSIDTAVVPRLNAANTFTVSSNFSAGVTSFGNFVLTTANIGRALLNGVAGCSLTSPTGMSGCTRNSQGNYTITLSPGLSNAACAASVDNTAATPIRLVYTHANSFTSVGVIVTDAAGSVQDANVNIICM